MSFTGQNSLTCGLVCVSDVDLEDLEELGSGEGQTAVNKSERDSVRAPDSLAEIPSLLYACVYLQMCVSGVAGQVPVFAARSYRRSRDEGERGAQESHRAE